MRPDEDDPARDGSMGRPLPGIETRVINGELQVRPDSVPSFFSHYIGEPPFDGEWWATGDQVRKDEDGYLWFEGRDDDIIITAGYRVGPFEVESALVSHPAVAEAAAVPAPDDERGSVVRAIVVLADGEPSDELAGELQEHVKRVTAPYKYPRIVEFADGAAEDAERKDPPRRAEMRSWAPPPSLASGRAGPANGRPSPGSSSSPTSVCSPWARRSPSCPTTSRTT